MPDVLAIALAVLATYRLATDLAWEDGPGHAYGRLRGWAVVRYGARHWIAEGLCCPICLSFWLSLPATAAAAVVRDWPVACWPLVWLAVAGGVAYLARRTAG